MKVQEARSRCPARDQLRAELVDSATAVNIAGDTITTAAVSRYVPESDAEELVDALKAREVPFFSITGSDFMEMFVGIGASRVRSLFEQAKQASPSIIFIDELDSIGRRRAEHREQLATCCSGHAVGFPGLADRSPNRRSSPKSVGCVPRRALVEAD